METTNDLPYMVFYRKWRILADKGYGERCDTKIQMDKVDARIRKAKQRYEKELEKYNKNQ